MKKNLLKLFGFYSFPPIMIPIVWIMYVLYFPIYYSVPLYDKLFGRWQCEYCNRKYGVKNKQTKVTQFSHSNKFVTKIKCENCQLADKLTAE